jgi:hypothetical protein
VLAPDWLLGLLAEHLAAAHPEPCRCHQLRYVFRGHRTVNGSAGQTGPRLIDVARRPEVAVGTVSAVLNDRAVVREPTRARIEAAIAELGYVRGAPAGTLAPHWRRNGFATWLFQPAATGRYPRKAPLPAHPVPVLADPWPGVPVRGRNAAGRADACWLPIAPGLTPHGLRHTYKTLMVELGTPATLMDAQMGHEDGSVQARYAHITSGMSGRLLDGLTELWTAALDARLEFSPGSPVTVLDRLLGERQA